MAEYEVRPINHDSWELFPLRRDISGQLMLNEFLVLPAAFTPTSGIVYQNPILGSQYLDLFAAFNRSGECHPLADLLQGRRAPNGEQVVCGARTLTCRYDSIFGLSLEVEGEEFRGEGAWAQALACLIHNDEVARR